MLDLRSQEGPVGRLPMRTNPTFALLVRQRNRLAWSLTAAILLIYYGFILLVAFEPSLMALPVSSTITLGFPLGLGVIVSAIVLTGIYVLRANAEFDSLTRQIVDENP